MFFIELSEWFLFPDHVAGEKMFNALGLSRGIEVENHPAY